MKGISTLRLSESETKQQTSHSQLFVSDEGWYQHQLTDCPLQLSFFGIAPIDPNKKKLKKKLFAICYNDQNHNQRAAPALELQETIIFRGSSDLAPRRSGGTTPSPYVTMMMKMRMTTMKMMMTMVMLMMMMMVMMMKMMTKMMMLMMGC